MLEKMLANKLEQKYKSLGQVGRHFDQLIADGSEAYRHNGSIIREWNEKMCDSFLNQNYWWMYGGDRPPLKSGDYDEEMAYAKKHFSAIVKNAKDYGFETDLSDNELARKINRGITKRGHRYCIVGFGGYMSNMLYIVNLATRITIYSTMGYTESMITTIYDNDTFSLDNVPRLMWDLTLVPNIEMYMEPTLESESLQRLLSKTNQASKNHSFKSIDIITRQMRFREESKSSGHNVYLGSPDFEGRRLLENENFYFFGHHGNETEIIYQPVVESDVTTETYGRMDVRAFWAGIFATTVKFAELMEMEELPKPEKGEVLYSFKAERKEAK